MTDVTQYAQVLEWSNLFSGFCLYPSGNNIGRNIKTSGLTVKVFRCASESQERTQVSMKVIKVLLLFLLFSAADLFAQAQGRTVVLDYYFNNETKKDATRRLVPYHYRWEDT